MSFLKLEQPKKIQRYEKLGYLSNPFPMRGKVAVEVYVERPELSRLQQELSNFLVANKDSGGFWVLEADRGIGKSNFLQHLDWELKQAQNDLLTTKIVSKYISSVISPRDLVKELVITIGEERFKDFLEQRISLPDSLKGTDLWRFFESKTIKQKGIHLIENPHAQFLMKWLMGNTTLAKEREPYQIWSKERVPPAVAFPYLKTIIAGMKEQNIIDKVILLIDEFEDIQQLDRKEKTEFIQTFKNMLNCFNWDTLFVIVAGQEGSFVTIGSQYTSLADRWQRVSLKPIESSTQAVRLAQAYMEYAHRIYCIEYRKNENKVTQLQPTEQEIKSIYADLDKSVKTQRDLLDKLYQFIESNLNDKTNGTSKERF